MNWKGAANVQKQQENRQHSLDRFQKWSMKVIEESRKQNDGRAVKLFLNDMCFDGEFLHYAEESPADTPTQ